MKIKKGDYGYIKSEKKKRLLRTVGYFIIPVGIFFLGYFLNKGDRMNIYSIIAAVGCIPGCISAVTMIAMWARKPMSEELYKEIDAINGIQTMAYELYITTQECSLFLDAVLFSGNAVTAYCDREVKKQDINAIQLHVKKALRLEKLEDNFRILDISNKKQFMDRIKSGRGSYKMRDHSNEEKMKEIILLLAL